jgi:hypothetical protein
LLLNAVFIIVDCLTMIIIYLTSLSLLLLDAAN